MFISPLDSHRACDTLLPGRNNKTMILRTKQINGAIVYAITHGDKTGWGFSVKEAWQMLASMFV